MLETDGFFANLGFDDEHKQLRRLRTGAIDLWSGVVERMEFRQRQGERRAKRESSYRSRRLDTTPEGQLNGGHGIHSPVAYWERFNVTAPHIS